jgi:hypothetical protein
MTRLQWNDKAFNLVSGPPGTGQLAALRAAAGRVDELISSGAHDVMFERLQRGYMVTSDRSVPQVFPYQSLNEEKR